MKRIIILIILFMSICTASFAKTEKMPCIKFKGDTYTLLYSAKNESVGTYMNEYYKKSESYTNWSELLAVHYYPNAYSPILQAHAMKDYLGAGLCPSTIEEDEVNNSATIDFVLLENKQIPILIEFNIFKYEKSPICGTVALQYAKRYRVNNGIELDQVKKEFQKSREKLLKQINKIEIPDLITVDVDNGKYLSNMTHEEDDKTENIDEQAQKTLD